MFAGSGNLGQHFENIWLSEWERDWSSYTPWHDALNNGELLTSFRRPTLLLLLLLYPSMPMSLPPTLPPPSLGAVLPPPSSAPPSYTWGPNPFLAAALSWMYWSNDAEAEKAEERSGAPADNDAADMPEDRKMRSSTRWSMARRERMMGNGLKFSLGGKCT